MREAFRHAIWDAEAAFQIITETQALTHVPHLRDFTVRVLHDLQKEIEIDLLSPIVDKTDDSRTADPSTDYG